jgi:hypothetical protein
MVDRYDGIDKDPEGAFVYYFLSQNYPKSNITVCASGGVSAPGMWANRHSCQVTMGSRVGILPAGASRSVNEDIQI